MKRVEILQGNKSFTTLSAMASRAFPRARSPSPSFSQLEAAAPSPPNLSPGSAAMGSFSSPPPPPMIGRAGNLTVFITPRSSRPSESPRSDFSTPTSQAAVAPPPPPASPSPQKTASPPAPPVKFSPTPLPVKISPPPVQVPPPQYEKGSTGGKHDGSAFEFLWDAVARVQEAHASLDEYVANWFGLDQSKYQWALNDYYENTGKNQECGKVGKPKELSTTKLQNV